MTVLETSRLALREITLTDAPALLRLYTEPSVARFLGPAPSSEAEEEDNIRRHRAEYYEARGFGLWAVMRRSSPQLVGRCGLLVSTIADRTETELSWVIAPTHQGQGLATEAAMAVRDYAANVLGRLRIVAVVAPDNWASIRVAQKLEMLRVGDVQYKDFGQAHLYVWERDWRRTL